MEKIKFSSLRGDFENKEEKCICIPLSPREGFDVDDVNCLWNEVEKKYSNLSFTKRWSTYNKDGEKGYLFFYK